MLGLPPAGTLVFIALNAVLIGLSEEWMFRGVLFQGLRSRLALWPAILLTSLLFGAVHVLNVISTGQLCRGRGQAVAASMSGMLLLALLIRTGSIWVPIAYHALVGLGEIRLTSATSPKTSEPVEFAQGWTWALPMLIVLPNFLYALFLLRKVRNASQPSTD